MVGAKNTQKCSQLVRNIPLESFRICIGRPKTMGSSSREAQRFLLYLATFANGDGTFTRQQGSQTLDYSPSEKTILGKHIKGRRSLYRLLDGLKEAGHLEWSRPDHYHRRRFRINLPAETGATNRRIRCHEYRNRCHVWQKKPKTGAISLDNIRLLYTVYSPVSPVRRPKGVGAESGRTSIGHERVGCDRRRRCNDG